MSGDIYGAIFGDQNGAWVTIETVNGLRMGHSSTVNMQIDPLGNCSFAVGAVTIDPTGIHIGLSNAIADTHAYSFSGSSFSGTNQCGVYAYEGSSTTRSLYLYNYTTQAASYAASILFAQSTAGTSAVFSAIDDHRGGGFGTGLFASVTIQPNVNNTIDLGTSSVGWRALYLSSTAAGVVFSGSCSVSNDFSTRLKLQGGSQAIFWDGTQFFPDADNAYLNGLYVAGVGNPHFAWAAVWSYAFSTASTREVKTDVAPCSLGTAFLLSLKPVDYRYNMSEGLPLRHGFIKEEVDQAYGGHCDGRGPTPGGLDYTQMIAPLVMGFQELEHRLAAVEAKLAV